MLETRSWEHGTSTRRRECFNGHRFVTVEIYREVYGSARQRAKVYSQSIQVWHDRWLRNLDIFKNQHLGWEHFVNKYQVGRSNFFLIAKQMRNHFRRTK